MNNFLRSVLPIVCITLMSALKAQTFNSGVEYLSYIGEQYSLISEDSWSYIRAASHSNSARKIDKRRITLISTIGAAKQKIEKLDGYNGNTTYRDAVVEYMTIDYQVMTEDYAKIVDMEAIAEQSYDNMEAYMLAKQLSREKLSKASDKVQKEQATFAEANRIKLNENNSERSKKIEISNKVYEHYNEVYLIFFKNLKQELYMLEACSSGNVNGIEQNKNALQSSVSEGMRGLIRMKPYQGDKSMIESTKTLFKFYKEEIASSNKVTSFFLKKENFERVKAAFDKIKSSKRTQADVDKYNKALNEYNQGINEYNNYSNTLNKRRTKLIDDWNRTAHKFTDEHVPKGK